MEGNNARQKMNSNQLPALPITLREKKRSIAITWSILIFFTCILEELVYFVIRYGAHKSTHVALTVPTAILGVFSVLTIGLRTYRLSKKGSDCRPIGGSWYNLDYFNWNMLIGFVVVTAVLASASGQDPPNIRQASMPQAIVLYLAGGQLFITAIMNSVGWETPLRLSSTLPRRLTPPGVFILVEDIVAVDGDGRQEFRKSLVARYNFSPQFRNMLVQLNWLWSVGSLTVAIGQTIICYVVSDLNIVFALGWSIPWVWATFGTCCTIYWSRRCLRNEHTYWDNLGAVAVQ